MGVLNCAKIVCGLKSCDIRERRSCEWWNDEGRKKACNHYLQGREEIRWKSMEVKRKVCEAKSEG